MLRRAWKPIIGATVLAAPPAYIYYRYTVSDKGSTFSINVKEKRPDGKATMVKHSFPLLSSAVVDQRINEFATFTSQPPSEGLVWKHTTAQLSSNDPIEDAHARAVITTDTTSSDPARSLLFFAVMDGHAGFHTSRLLSQVLIPAISLELDLLSGKGSASTKSSSSLLDILKYPFFSSSLRRTDAPQIGQVEKVSRAIQRAFYNLDSEIVNGPLRVLAANIGKLDKMDVPDLSQHPMGEASMLPALSGTFSPSFNTPANDFVPGSCALMAFLDPSREDLYVACTGDSRAVAGIWEENGDGTGKWRVEVLTEDQTGRNPNEIKRCAVWFMHAIKHFLTRVYLSRIRSEHPASEAEDVISRGRILGGLEPSRAFGDARYKWPREVQEMYAPGYPICHHIMPNLGTYADYIKHLSQARADPCVPRHPHRKHHRMSPQRQSSPIGNFPFPTLDHQSRNHPPH
jgi:pyruvate dehydrogenase phosphatase